MLRPRLRGTQGNSPDESKVEMLLIDQSNPDYSRIKKICKYSFKILFKLFTFVCAGSSFCMWAFLVSVSGDYSSLRCTGFSSQWLFRWSTGFRARGLQ